MCTRCTAFSLTRSLRNSPANGPCTSSGPVREWWRRKKGPKPVNSITPTGFARDRQLRQSRDDNVSLYFPSIIFSRLPLSLSLCLSLLHVALRHSLFHIIPIIYAEPRALISGNLLFPSGDKKIFRKKSTDVSSFFLYG